MSHMVPHIFTRLNKIFPSTLITTQFEILTWHSTCYANSLTGFSNAKISIHDEEKIRLNCKTTAHHKLGIFIIFFGSNSSYFSIFPALPRLLFTFPSAKKNSQIVMYKRFKMLENLLRCMHMDTRAGVLK